MKTYHAESARAGLDAASRAGLGWEEFGLAVIDLLPQAVPFDAFCFGTIDPATDLLTGSVKAGIDDSADGRFVRYEYVEDDVFLFADIAKTPTGVAVLHHETNGDPHRSIRYRELTRPYYGQEHEMRASMRLGGQTWGHCAIYREPGRSGFSPGEAEFMQRLQETLARGVRAGLIASVASSAAVSSDDGPVVVVFDASGSVVQATPAAERRVADLGGDLWGVLPMQVSAIVAAAGATVTGQRTGVPRMRVRTAGGEWLTLHAAPLSQAGESAPLVAVTIERSSAPQIIPLIVAAYGLTDREQDVVQQVLAGASTSEISAALNLSPYTVQDHLKLIFEKVGVSSRRELQSKVFFSHYADKLGAERDPSSWFLTRAG